MKDRKDEDFLGTREKNADGTFGAYKWSTYGQVQNKAHRIARAIKKLDLAPEVEGEGRLWRFNGIWAKNREEWLITYLGA